MSLHEYGWARYAPATASDPHCGRVALVHRDHSIVWTAAGEVIATLSGHLRHLDAAQPCVGDWVILREGAVIAEILPRRTKLSRKQPGRRLREQVLAANMDLLFLVSGLDRDYNPRRIERYLVIAHESGARPIVLLNKADLRSDLPDVLRRTERHAPGVPVFALSALEQWGLEAITESVAPGETAALIGSSGAGKSTLVNALIGEVCQRTADVRASDSKGRHTTTHRELIRMPLSERKAEDFAYKPASSSAKRSVGTMTPSVSDIGANRIDRAAGACAPDGQSGWLLMDLPGLRELQLWADPEGIDDAFAEIAVLAAQCRFRDCTHQSEPGCAVRDATLDPARLASYRKLQREVRHLELQTDIHRAREERKKWNAVEKDIRRHPKRRF
jgi:ribosome biogenesis GTPase